MWQTQHTAEGANVDCRLPASGGQAAHNAGPDAGTSRFTELEQVTLLELAASAVTCTARGIALPDVHLPQLPAVLQAPGATFVTLRRSGELRGCCGTVRAYEPLGLNVVRSATSAARYDRRFSAIRPDELGELDLHLSVLSEPTPLRMLTEADLISALRPGIDGLILIDAELERQGVFLPAVWEQLPDRREFVRRLKQKAGLPPDYWSPWLEAHCFTVEGFHRSVTARR